MEDFVKDLLSLLYVEDDQISREIVSMYLKDDFKVETAKDSCEAINKVKASITAVLNGTGKRFSLILMDINLRRGLGGLELAKQIKSHTEYEHIPIVAVTAYAFKEDVKKILNGGCTHYISKPFNRKSLIETLHQALDSSTAIYL